MNVGLSSNDQWAARSLCAPDTQEKIVNGGAAVTMAATSGKLEAHWMSAKPLDRDCNDFNVSTPLTY